MNFNVKQKRLLQDLGLTNWQKKSSAPLFCVQRGAIVLAFQFPRAGFEIGQQNATKIAKTLGVAVIKEQQPTKVMQCSCEPRDIYEKMRHGCFD